MSSRSGEIWKNKKNNSEAELVAKLVKAREKKGMTQTELAEKSGLKQAAVARLESLRSVPKIDTVNKLLKPLGYKLAIVPVR